MLFVSYSCTTDESKSNGETLLRKANAPYGLITPERAKELNQNWNFTRAAAIENAIGKVDNQSVKFSLQDLRDYLDYAENESKLLGYDMDGVRIYFAAYGNNEPNGKAGQATVFIVPTGTQLMSEANMFMMFQSTGGGGDIPGGSGLNFGGEGNPPGINYPQ